MKNEKLFDSKKEEFSMENTEKVTLDVLDSVHVKTNDIGKRLLHSPLSYNDVYWTKGQFGRKERVEYTVSLVQRSKGIGWVFPTGLLTKALEFLRKNKIEYSLQNDITPVEWDDPYLEGITFRPDQQRLIENALATGRGVLKAPTGSGKSIIIGGLMSSFSEENILFLSHTTDLVTQMRDNLEAFNFPMNEVGLIGGSEKTWGRIQMSTIQSFANLEPHKYSHKYDVIIIDEVHRVSSMTGNYGKVLMACLAPVKLGLTATLPYKEPALMAMESLVGPVIGEVTIKEGNALGLLAIPIIKLVKAPQNVPKGDTYGEIYTSGIVMNSERNRKIINMAKGLVNTGQTVIINVRQIEHGVRLLSFAQDQGLKTVFVHGKSTQQERTAAKNALEKKHLKCVIASTIWEAGINIPSLNAVINAAGGKSDIYVIQTIGRGLRVTDTKKEVTIIDLYDDSHKWFRSHFNKRRNLYIKNGWI